MNHEWSYIVFSIHNISSHLVNSICLVDDADGTIDLVPLVSVLAQYSYWYLLDQEIPRSALLHGQRWVPRVHWVRQALCVPRVVLPTQVLWPYLDYQLAPLGYWGGDSAHISFGDDRCAFL